MDIARSAGPSGALPHGWARLTPRLEETYAAVARWAASTSEMVP